MVNTRITMFPFQQYVNTSHKHIEIIVFNWTFVAVTLYLQFTFTDTRKKKRTYHVQTPGVLWFYRQHRGFYLSVRSANWRVFFFPML